MNDLFNAHDATHVAVNVIGLIIAVVVIKRDLFWLRKSFEEHREDDKEQFKVVREDVKDLRADVRNER